VIGDGQRLEPQSKRLCDKVFRCRRTVQKAERGVAVQLCIRNRSAMFDCRGSCCSRVGRL
jgi:hypothetical protein